jgi:putative membrane protein
MADMVKDHTKDVAEFQREAKSGSNPDIKQFASSTLPTLESHLSEAKSVDSKVKTSGKPAPKAKGGQQ